MFDEQVMIEEGHGDFGWRQVDRMDAEAAEFFEDDLAVAAEIGGDDGAGDLAAIGRVLLEDFGEQVVADGDVDQQVAFG